MRSNLLISPSPFEDTPMAKPKPKNSPRLDTPTDLSTNATPEIAEALNGCLADAFALYLKTKNFHWHNERAAFSRLPPAPCKPVESAEPSIDGSAFCPLRQRPRLCAHTLPGTPSGKRRTTLESANAPGGNRTHNQPLIRGVPCGDGI